MTFAATLNILESEPLFQRAVPIAPKGAATDWVREYPEEQFVRLAIGWRAMIVGTATAAAWAAIGGIGFSVARVFGMI